jgi:Domain of unknown function (DUF4440)
MRKFALSLWLSALPAAAMATSVAPVAPPPGEALTESIRTRDAEFFGLFFEGCDPARLATMITKDMEFYHDKGGVVARSAEPFVAEYAKNCGARKAPGAWRSRRELVPASLKVWPIAAYGAVEGGEHLFYERKGDGPEKLVGRALFTQLWKWEDGRWKLARVFSYAHAPAE